MIRTLLLCLTIVVASSFAFDSAATNALFDLALYEFRFAEIQNFEDVALDPVTVNWGTGSNSSQVTLVVRKYSVYGFQSLFRQRSCGIEQSGYIVCYVSANHIVASFEAVVVRPEQDPKPEYRFSNVWYDPVLRFTYEGSGPVASPVKSIELSNLSSDVYAASIMKGSDFLSIRDVTEDWKTHLSNELRSALNTVILTSFNRVQSNITLPNIH